MALRTRRLLTPVVFVAALLFVALDEMLQALVRLAQHVPLPALWRRFEDWMAALPPYGAVACLSFPFAAFASLQSADLILLGMGHVAAAAAASVCAKLMLGLSLRLWGRLKDSACRVAWFARLVAWLHAVHAAVHAWLDRFAVWRLARAAVGRAKARARDILAALRRRKGWFSRRVLAIRRRLNRSA
ncbi:MAG: hypothetical protein ACM33T_05525 [Solirubrobacterales bacterium]